DFAFPESVETLVLRKAALEFAWGPRSGGEPERIGAVEIALAAGEGGAGTLWIEELRIEPRDPAAAQPQAHAARASSGSAGHEPERGLDDDAQTSWRPAAADAQPWLQLDFGRVSEWGGLVVDFAEASAACAGRLLASADGVDWKPLAADPGGPGTRR